MSAAARPHVVFDCMTFLQAAASPDGPAAACLRLVETEIVALLVSREILKELRDVLTRPKVRRKNPRLRDETIQALLDGLAAKAIAIDPVPETFRYPRDPKDEPYINLAIAAGARFLVSWDKDLLDLAADEAFRTANPHLRIVDPVTFLREMDAGTSGSERRP
jgi:putative PIN family toxin of toxin-antitoxin system